MTLSKNECKFLELNKRYKRKVLSRLHYKTSESILQNQSLEEVTFTEALFTWIIVKANSAGSVPETILSPIYIWINFTLITICDIGMIVFAFFSVLIICKFIPPSSQCYNVDIIVFFLFRRNRHRKISKFLKVMY